MNINYYKKSLISSHWQTNITKIKIKSKKKKKATMLNSMSPSSGVCWKRGAVQKKLELNEVSTQNNAKMSDNVC